MMSTYGTATEEECPQVEMIPSEMAALMPVPPSWMDLGSSVSSSGSSSGIAVTAVAIASLASVQSRSIQSCVRK